MNEGLTLKIKIQVAECWSKLFQPPIEIFSFQISRIARELLQSGRTFGTTQVAGGGGLYAQGDGHSPRARSLE
jgi:hypothetical protein